MEEVEWLRAKLESLETALLAGSLDSGLLAALDGTGADVLEAARAAVLGSGAPDLQLDSVRAHPGSVLDPLSSQLAAPYEAAATAAAGNEADTASSGLGAAALLQEAVVLPNASCQAGDAGEQTDAVAPVEQKEQRAVAKAPLIDPHLITSELEEATLGSTPIAAVWPSSRGGSGDSVSDAVAGVADSGLVAAPGSAEQAKPPAPDVTATVVLITRPPTGKGVLQLAPPTDVSAY